MQESITEKKVKKSLPQEIVKKHNDDIKKYVSDIISEKISSCEYTKSACKRHLDDLKRDDIYFDEEAAARAIFFCETMKHVKGVLSGSKIKLEPWQKFFVGSIFGWKKKETGRRRFREATLIVTRKNAKTTIAAALGHYALVADGEKGAEVFCAATTEQQAYILFNIARSMVIVNEKFKDKFGLTCTKELISQQKTMSSFQPVIGTPRDGTNPSLAIIDEYHEHLTDTAYDSLKTGMGAREQPLLLIISTAGKNIKGPCFRHVEYGRKVVTDVMKNDTMFYLEYGIDKEDDWKDYSCWKKANPNLGVSVSEEFLRSQYEAALSRPDKRSEILTKQLNVWNNESIGWIDLQKWFECGNGNLSLDQFEGKKCFIGMDCASRIDLVTLMIVFRTGDKYTVFGKYYLPSDTIDKPENDHYRVWEAEGWLTRSGEARTDLHALEEDLKALSERFQIVELAYDPREAEYLVQNIRTWATFPCIDVPQSPMHFSEPMKVIEGAYMSGDLQHQNDPILNWAASNVVLKNTNNKLIYPAKPSEDRKIDPIVATIMAVGRAALLEEDAVEFFFDFF